MGSALLVALVNVPDAARIVRAAAREGGARPAVEALRMQGESWWRMAVGYVGRSMLRTLAADAGIRLTGVLYLVATAAFLGVGVAPDAADWAVMVDRNRTGLFVPVGRGRPRPADRRSRWAPTCSSTALADEKRPARRPSISRTRPGPPAPAGSETPVSHTDERNRAASPTCAPPPDRRPWLDGGAIVDDAKPAGTLALVGASGSGKTTTGLALLGEYPPGGPRTGDVTPGGVDVLQWPRRSARRLHPPAPGRRPQPRPPHLRPPDGHRPRQYAPPRGRRAQRPANASPTPCSARLSDGEALLRRYPHQLSGGQQQRVVLAQALLLGARVVVADEPTTGQDALTKSRVVDQLAAVAARGIAVVLLSHDLDVVRALADEVIVLRAGGSWSRAQPSDCCSRRGTNGPANCSPGNRSTRTGKPDRHRPPRPADPRPDRPPPRQHTRHDRGTAPDAELDLRAGESLAVVGRSGSGKTTLARCLAGLHRDHDGEILLDGTPLPRSLRDRDRAQLAAVQYVFQDAHAAFDEHRPVLHQVARTAVRLRGTDDCRRDRRP